MWLVVASADAVPMSTTGKVDKSALQQLLRSRGMRFGVDRVTASR